MFDIDRYSGKPIYEQIIEQTEEMILRGELKPGEQAPSVRSLAVALTINPNTLQKAYAELERRGVCVSAPGNGRFITHNALEILREIANNKQVICFTCQERESNVS